MGYFKEKQLNVIMEKIEKALTEGIKNLNPNGSLINYWAFSDNGDVLLLQELECGCKNIVSKVELNIDKKELDVIKEDEFVLQMEDILLEVNDLKSYDNLLFNIEDISEVKTSCSICSR